MYAPERKLSLYALAALSLHSSCIVSCVRKSRFLIRRTAELNIVELEVTAASIDPVYTSLDRLLRRHNTCVLSSYFTYTRSRTILHARVASVNGCPIENSQMGRLLDDLRQNLLSGSAPTPSSIHLIKRSLANHANVRERQQQT
jgi:hypothetical protein